MNKGGTYRIRYGDGEVEDHVKVSCLSNSSTETNRNKKLGRLQVGDNVEGNYKSKGLWIRGLITHVNRGHQSYDICYKTGIEEYGVTHSNVRLLGGYMYNETRSRRKSPRGDDNDESDSDGAAFLGNSEGSSFKGKRTWVNGDENLNLESHNGSTQQDHSYIDIDTESDNDASHEPKTHHHVSSTSKLSRSNTSNIDDFKLFDIIEASYKGTGKWLRGKICHIHGDGLSYDILYDNNKYRRENYVKAHEICFLSHQPEEEIVESEPKKGLLRFRIGDEIEVNNYKGENKWHRGIIRSVHRDGSYEIQYANGDCEDVSSSNVRSIVNKRPKSSQRSISDSESEEDQPYQLSPQHPRRQRSLYPKLIGSGSDTDSEEFNTSEGAEKKLRELNNNSKMKSGSDTTKGGSSVCLVSERLWSVLSSAARGGVDVKQAAKGILRKAFESVDKDNDGLITSLQLYKLLKWLDEPILDEEEVTDLFQVMDHKRNGLVSLRDIVELALWDPKGVDVPIDVLPVYKRLAEEATANIKLPCRKRSVGRGNASGGSVDRVKCVEDALAGERAPRWSELPRRLATVGVTVRSRDVDVLECVLDTEETGRVPSEVFAVWLCSGLDTAMLKLKARHLLREVEERGVDPEMVLKQAHKQSGGKDRGKTMSEDAFIEGLRMLGMPLTHSQLCGLINAFSVDEGDENNSSEGFDYSQTTSKQIKKEIDVIQFLELSSERQLLHGDDKPHSRRWKSSKLSPIMGSKVVKRAAHRKKGEKHGKKKLNVDSSSSENDVVSEGEGTSAEMFSSEDDGCDNQEEDYGNNIVLFDRKTLKALWSLAIEDASQGRTLRDAFKKRPDDNTTEDDDVLPIRRCEKVLRKQLGSKVSKQQLRTVMEFLSKLQEIESHTTGSQAIIPLLDIMELSLSQTKSSYMLTDLHNRMAKDLAVKVSKKGESQMLHSKAANDSNKGKGEDLNIQNIISIVTKPFKSFARTTKNAGSVTSKAFKKGLTKLGCGMLTDSEKSYLIEHFDVNKEEMINFEQFGLWLASGLDLKRLKNKMKCLRKMLKTKGISLSVTLKRLANNNSGRIDRDRVCQCLRDTLGFPFTHGEMRALLILSSTSSQSRGGGGGIDIDLLLNGITGWNGGMLRHGNKPREDYTTSDECGDDDMFDKGLSGGKGRHQGQNVVLNCTTQKSEINNHQTANQDTNKSGNAITTKDKDNDKIMTKEHHKHSRARGDRGKRNDLQKIMSQFSTNVRVRIHELMAKGCDTDWEVKLDKCSGAESGL